MRVGVWQLGGIFVHRRPEERLAETFTFRIGESTMKEALSADQEALAQELAQAIAQAATDEFLQIARTLVATDRSSLFGDTEFQIRDILLRLGAKAYQELLAQKKTATKAPA
jgi:hypothetical protein